MEGTKIKRQFHINQNNYSDFTPTRMITQLRRVAGSTIYIIPIQLNGSPCIGTVVIGVARGPGGARAPRGLGSQQQQQKEGEKRGKGEKKEKGGEKEVIRMTFQNNCMKA